MVNIIAEGKSGRSFGSDSNFVAENKIVTEVIKNKKWVGKNQPDARKVLLELMNDKDAPASIRKGIAEFIYNKGEQYFKEQGGVAKKAPTKEDKKKADIINLEFKETGTDK